MAQQTHHVRLAVLFAAMSARMLCPCAAAADPSVESGQLMPLPLMLDITWRRGPSFPQGLQDSKGGIIDGRLISVGGFCSGEQGVPGKPDKYPRGFLRKVWALRVGNGEHFDRVTADRWQSLPDFPGTARQGLDVVAHGGKLYAFGGFNYDAPYSYRDGYRLSIDEGRWRWQPLPTLPWPIAGHGSCMLDGKIYVVGGADYDAQAFHTAANRNGDTPRIGARLLALDTRKLDHGWQELPECPGTPRFVHAVAAVDGRIFVIGGAASGEAEKAGTYTVVDNWRFDPAAMRWERLPDTPVASGNFPAGAIVCRQRYILLVGGYQYGQVMRPDGSLAPVYGTPTRRYPDNPMCSDVFVFDTHTGTFGRATPLPMNNNLPMTVLDGDRIHLIGGEAGAIEIDGEHFGHHPDLYLVGTIQRHDAATQNRQ